MHIARTTSTRRTVLTQLALMPFAGAAASLLSSCGVGVGEVVDGPMDELGSTEAELRSCSSLTSNVGTNHGHTVTVPVADVTAGKAKTYVLAGPHAHSVTVSVAAFATLKSTGVVRALSTNALGHVHEITLTCTGPTVVTNRCVTGTPVATISSNHGHSLSVPKADIAAGVAKSYSVRGSAGHDHTVTLGSSDFAALRAGSTLTVTSSSGFGHAHGVVVRCG